VIVARKTVQLFLHSRHAGGNYRLSAASPFVGSATDSTDVGANIDAINAAAGTHY